MKNDKIAVAWLWSRYEGHVCFGAPTILGLDPQRYKPICVYLMKNSEKPNYFEEKGYKAFYISRKKFLRAFNLWVIWKLSRVLKRENVDILHCQKHQSAIYGALAAKIAGVPVVFAHVHGLNRSKNPRRKFINWVVLRWVTKILAVSKAVKEDVLRDNPVVRPEQVIVVGNSIDYDRFANVQITKEQAKQNINLRTNSFVFGTVGRLAPTKGQSYLISAFAKVKKQIPQAHLVFIGDGRLRNQLEAQAAKVMPNSIHFLGHKSNVLELFRAMDVFVLPSIAEGMPFVILEAMAAGVPCIATKVGGIPEIISDGNMGVLVPPKDENALADAMIKLTKMFEKERKKIIEKARQRVIDDYSHEVVRKKLERIYDNEMENKTCQGNKIKLLVLSRYPTAANPSFRQRIKLHFNTLCKFGIECEVAKLPSGSLARRKLFKQATEFDGVFLHRKRLRAFDVFWLRRYAHTIIYDFDDPVMYDYEHPDKPDRKQQKSFERTVKLADLVIAQNSVLANYARNFNENVEVLSTGLDTNAYKLENQPEKDDGKLRLVWIGTGSTLRYLAEIKPALEEIGSRFDNVVLRIICDDFFDLQNMEVEKHRWSLEKQAVDLATSDIGLAPLPNDKFSQSKSCFKILQYQAAALPVIASPVGANTEDVQDGINAFLARDSSDWLEKISTLLKDSQLRKQMGQAGRVDVQQFDLKVLGEQLANLIKRCLKNDRM